MSEESKYTQPTEFNYPHYYNTEHTELQRSHYHNGVKNYNEVPQCIPIAVINYLKLKGYDHQVGDRLFEAYKERYGENEDDFKYGENEDDFKYGENEDDFKYGLGNDFGYYFKELGYSIEEEKHNWQGTFGLDHFAVDIQDAYNQWLGQEPVVPVLKDDVHTLETYLQQGYFCAVRVCQDAMLCCLDDNKELCFIPGSYKLIECLEDNNLSCPIQGINPLNDVIERHVNRLKDDKVRAKADTPNTYAAESKRLDEQMQDMGYKGYVAIKLSNQTSLFEPVYDLCSES